MTEYLDRNAIISLQQFWFCKAHSTTHLLLNVRCFIESKIRQKEDIVLISLDLSKAFDCVDTSKILQSNIKYYTGSNKITNWIDSFYKDRHQYTKWEETVSETIKNQNISIVQDSSLVPKLFNMYLNDLSGVSDLFEMALFADLMLSNRNAKTLEEQVSKELIKIKDYFDSNGLAINTSKTTYLYLCPKH